MMSSMSGFRGDVMAESSRLQPVGPARYRDGGGSGLSRDYFMDTQPLDYSTKSLHSMPLSLTSIDSGTSLTDTVTTSFFKKVLPSKASPTNASESLPLTTKCPSPMSYSPAPHVPSYSQAHARSHSPPPPAFPHLLRTECQSPMSYSSVPHIPSYSQAHARSHSPPPPPFPHLLQPPPPPPAPPAAQMPSPTLPSIASAFHNPAAVSSLILAQLQANPLLFSTLLARSNLMAQQQQLHLKDAAASSPCKSPPSFEPALSGFSGGAFGMAGLGPSTMGLMHNKNYPGDQVGAVSGMMPNTTQEELVLLERSNEEYRNFRDNFITESCKMRHRRGGRRSSTAPGAVSSSGNTCGRNAGAAADDSAGEGSIDVVSGDSADGGDFDTKTHDDGEKNAEAGQQDEGPESLGLVPKRRNRQGGENTQKDEAYWERRRRNNEAAKRSRDARRAKEEEIAIRGAFLEQENMKLRAELSTLKSETAKLRCMLYNS